MSEQTLIIHAGTRKTGTTAIQHYLFEQLNHPEYDYFATKIPNSSLIVRKAFSRRAETEAGQDAGAAREDRLATRERLVSRLSGYHKRNVILSAESTASLNAEELAEFRATVSKQFQKIRVILYIRPVRSRIESAFQEQLKHKFAAHDSPKPVQLKRFVQKFDRVFGAENVELRPFDPRAFPNRSVVNDFLAAVGIDNVTLPLKRSNSGLSFQAVQLLYVYRRTFPSAIRQDKALIKALGDLEGDKFRMHDDLLAQIVNEQNAHYEWFESRAGFSVKEKSRQHDGPMVLEENDLLDVPAESLEWLVDRLGEGDSPPPAPGDYEAIAEHIRRLALQL